MAKLHAGEVDAMALVTKIEEAFASNPFLVISASGDYSGRAGRYAAMVAVHVLIDGTDQAGLAEDVPG